MLWKRVVSAAVALPGVLCLVHFGPTWAWGLFIAVCAAVALHEYLAITVSTLSLRARAALVAVGVGAFWAFHALSPGGVVLALAALFGLTFSIFLFHPGDLGTAFPHVAAVFSGYLYVSLLLALLVRLHALPNGREWIYVAFLVAWCGDTAAYFAGRAFGRRKLYPLISPGKTVEGGVGGLLGSLAGVVVARYSFFPELGIAGCFLVAIPGGLAGQIGDLCESMLKRSYGVKDSGIIMPGHGGLLDRIDALLFIVPIVFAYAETLHGRVL